MHLTLFAILLSLMFPVYTPQRRIQADQNTVSGVLTVDGKATQLNYGYAIDYGDGLVIFLTDKPMMHDEADGGYGIKEKKLRGFKLVIKKKTNKLLEAIAFHEAVTSAAWYIKDLDTLEFQSFDAKTVSGKLLSRKPEQWNGKTYTYDVKFALIVKPPIDSAAVKVTGNGIETAPGKAFAEYHKVAMTGNHLQLGQYFSETIPDSYKSADALESLQGSKKMESPAELTIKKVDIQADSAELVVEGSRGRKNVAGRIKMKLEKGKWRIVEENWKSEER
jgi:hypothetical protein